MASAGSQGSGFKTETIQYVIETIQSVWSDNSGKKLALLYSYFKSKGVKSEGDVETIDEAELSRVIGLDAAKRILKQFEKLNRKEKLLKKNKNTSSQPVPEGANEWRFEFYSGPRDSPRGYQDNYTQTDSLPDHQDNYTQMFRMFNQFQVDQECANKEMMTQLMERTLTSTEAMSEKLADQMHVQREHLNMLHQRLAAIEERLLDTARQTQEMNHRFETMTRQLSAGSGSQRRFL